MANEYEQLREIDTRWTPLTPEIRSLIEKCKKEAGSLRILCEATGFRPRYIRRLLQTEPKKYARPLKSVSYVTLERIIGLSSVSHYLTMLPWYTIEEMQEKGIWDLPLPHIVRKTIAGEGRNDTTEDEESDAA